MKESARNCRVYVLASRSRNNFVKVGRSNNRHRIPALLRMGYGGVTDWIVAKEVFVSSSQAAIAIESMIHARLTNQGYRVPRFPWTNLKNLRPSFADECFNCTAKHAVVVAEQMESVYEKNVA